ncbi:MAG: 16S rRNA (cytosine(967)-C(5))-methyltransferase, partial [Clostridia bacterium]|nr:16S rRNA (cytosine(967)-C(5))-methyltransferase [Clostridia bacterium]
AISPCERILDACAAPGGKSVALSKKCKQVIACELHEHRTQLIRDYAQRMGAENVTAVTADSSVFNKEFENAFDAVLCDVPCSGTGVTGENPDIKLNRREEDIPSLNKIQSAILNNCARYVKSGGALYYSTCSVLPEENDSIAVGFLQSHPDFELKIPSSPLAHKQTAYGLQFLPHLSLGAGFYLTAFIKK